eukprot:CAMPEP_0196814424 /NCGR_PEP_ID=MMETSP1362-20130617/43117_1 /TAXON_ID=163516 /ORGANISM="Leptocylindrus danicus, Strain CCMP1856" /LENGTH=272 /DNA_ID=CAMNT_0042191029 /DNA_START=35 /DNA_END=853 /DNA_ORIENTATION=-
MPRNTINLTLLWSLLCANYTNAFTLSMSASTLPAGITKKTLVQPSNPSNRIEVGDVATVKYTCSTTGNSPVIFASGTSDKMVAGEGLMVDGWELALLTMSKGERSVYQIAPDGAAKYGYGTAGVPPIIGSNAPLEFDITILDVEQGVDLGTIASADPLKPRDPKSIAAAYSTRRELAALEEANQKEGIEGLIEKFKGYYFFGFFEGETGQAAPWYLKPAITFPLAFAIVGATFYVSLKGGAIYERGAQITDELDDIVLTNFVWLLAALANLN